MYCSICKIEKSKDKYYKGWSICKECIRQEMRKDEKDDWACPRCGAKQEWCEDEDGGYAYVPHSAFCPLQ